MLSKPTCGAIADKQVGLAAEVPACCCACSCGVPVVEV